MVKILLINFHPTDNKKIGVMHLPQVPTKNDYLWYQNERYIIHGVQYADNSGDTLLWVESTDNKLKRELEEREEIEAKYKKQNNDYEEQMNFLKEEKNKIVELNKTQDLKMSKVNKACNALMYISWILFICEFFTKGSLCLAFFISGMVICLIGLVILFIGHKVIYG